MGIPHGHDTVIDVARFELEPRLVSISIDSGSIGGSLIVARIEGVGINYVDTKIFPIPSYEI